MSETAKPTGAVLYEQFVADQFADPEFRAAYEEEAPKVVNLMEALRQSLERVSVAKKRPVAAKASVAKHTPKKRARG